LQTEPTNRVLIVLPQPFYEDRGTSIALGHFLRALAELRYPVDILCFEPGRDLELPGVRLIRTPNPFGFKHVPIGLSGKKLLLDLFLARATARQLRRERYLCVHAVEEAAFIAAALRRSHDIFVTYDMQSALPEQLVQYRGLGGRSMQAVAHRLEAWLVRNVDLVICSAGLEDRVRSHPASARLHSWRFPAELDPPLARDVARLRRKLRLPHDAKVVMYMGSFARYQGISVLAEAVPSVLDRVSNAIFLLVGAASEEEAASVTAAIPSHLADRVRVRRRIGRHETPNYLALADVLMSPRIHGDNLPLKAFDYLITGKPIVASDIPAHRALFDEGVALLSPPTAEGFADAICQVLESGELSSGLESAARAFSEEHLIWERFVERVDEMMRDIALRVGEADNSDSSRFRN